MKLLTLVFVMMIYSSDIFSQNSNFKKQPLSQKQSSQQMSEKTSSSIQQQIYTQTDISATTSQMLSSSDPIIRRQAIINLSQTRDLKYADIIEKYIEDQDKLVRMAAIESLGMMRSEKSIDKILTILSKTSDNDIKNSCLIAISYMPKLNKPDKIIELALKDENENIKVVAIRTLGSFNIKSIENDMIKLVEDKKSNTFIKQSAINYLGAIKSTTSIELLLKLTKSEEKQIKISAIRALGDIGDLKASEALRVRVGEDDADVQIESALALAKMGDNFGLSFIYKYLDSDNIAYKNMALNIIGMVGNEQSIAILEEKIKKITDPSLKSFMEFTKERIKARIRSKA
ncbi:MAG: HEAT repeat domain-containing protein [Elusimicrobiota bacterium]